MSSREPVRLTPVGPLPEYEWRPPEPPEPVMVETDDEPDAPLDEESWMPRTLAEWLAIAQTALPAALLLPGSQAYRFPLRLGAYVISLYAFGVWFFDRGGKTGQHPVQRWLNLMAGWLMLMIFHPQTSSLSAGLATLAMYFAIFCPVYWMPSYVRTRRQLVRILVFLLVCNGINSVVGVLQVYDPERWMPRELSAAYRFDANLLAAATYIGPNGVRITRPPGLFDTPGAVCGAGTIAALLGLVFALEPIAWWKRLLALGFAGAGISAIYLSHVRASLVVALIMMATYAFLLTVQRQQKRMTAFTSLAAGLVVAGLSFATILGGTAVRDRFTSLLEGDPRETYYNARGMQVEQAFTDLAAQYPLGAGLARWGMMQVYFGNTTGRNADVGVFAETQPSAWVIDGGLLLLGLYPLALIATSSYGFRLVRTLTDDDDRLWSASVVAVNIGTLALVFSFVPFATAIGMQYWFLEGALHGAMRRHAGAT